MSGLFFYKNIEPLNKEKHKGYKLAPADNGFSFVKESIAVLLAGAEFIEASKEFPIVFVKNEQECLVPAVLLGLRDNENLFVDKNNQWTGQYIPAFIRRYPFVFAGNEEKLTVCIDSDFSGFQQQEGEDLFSDEGETLPALQKAIDFLMEYQRQFKRTEVFVKRLEDEDLFTSLNANVSMNDGRQFSLTGFYIIDEKKLSVLDDKKVLEIFRLGEFAWVYAHLASLNNLQKMVNLVPTD